MNYAALNRMRAAVAMEMAATATRRPRRIYLSLAREWDAAADVAELKRGADPHHA